VDAVGTWDGQHLTIQQTAANDGEQAWLDQTEVFWNLDYLGDIFVTTRSFFEENEAAVVGFARGMQRGQQFELDNPQAALEHVSKHVEGVDPSSADDLAQLDYPGIEKALGVYYDTKLTSVHPGALDLSRLFIQEVPDQVAAG
jgi:ABC-type nitrate/sulfonate/bicarbonate transport system substrate-binding protein